MSSMKIVKTIFLKAPPEHVWKFLVEADKLATWFHQGEADLKEGGDWALLINTLGKEGERMCWGKVLEMKPPAKLVHTFTHPHLQEVETTCTWTLEGVKGGTILTLVHEGWENFEADPFGMAANHDTGWDEHFTRLRRVTG
ncbi:SRPBCC family protein [Hyphococcus sp.]|uniref:SRPBCC family protein n=1 Tax=Hyphococcus sp. TaxID=2038636 RepID=UPI003CCC15F4